MNKNLQRYMNNRYRGSIQLPVAQRGASSLTETNIFRNNLLDMFKRNNIKSIFDSGCNDSLFGAVMATEIKYQGGDIAIGLIAEAWAYNPNLDIIVHDCTTDLYPKTDCVFIRDVTIHLTGSDQKKFVQNWKDSVIPWLAISHNCAITENSDFEYKDNIFHARETNWQISPWNWPEPIDYVLEFGSSNDRRISLWHKDQI